MSVVPAGVQVPNVPVNVQEVLEGATPTPAPEVKAPDNLAKHFAALSKKERALFREKEAIKAERAAMAAEKAQVAELQARYGTRPATPQEALARYGYSYKDATDFELNDGAPSAEHIARMAQSEVQKLRDEQAARDKQAAEDAIKRAEADRAEVITEFQSEIRDFIAEKADDYELIKFHEAEEVVYHTVEAHFAKTGKLLSIPEAATMVEKHLESRLEKLQATKKSAKLRQGDPQTPESGFGRQSEIPAKTRTIDNSVTASTSPTLIKTPRVEEDRMRRALAKLS